jgi:putative tricarboxylic transport membrane protein
MLVGGARGLASLRALRPKISGTVGWIVLALVLNLVMAETVGFVAASTTMFWLTARAFDDRHPIRDALFALTLSLAAFVLFGRLLQLSLPSGPIEAWL